MENLGEYQQLKTLKDGGDILGDRKLAKKEEGDLRSFTLPIRSLQNYVYKPTNMKSKFLIKI
jgi:hypothetical protein